jgi:two-component system CheB/CheR fusion protein
MLLHGIQPVLIEARDEPVTVCHTIPAGSLLMTRQKKRASKARTKPRRAVPLPARDNEALASYTGSLFPIVGVGASAGGLESVSELLRNLPSRPGLAVVFVQHQEPKHESLLAQILSRVTSMPVQTISANTRVETDHVYIAPPGSYVTIDNGVLDLLPLGGHMPIDVFFRALAEDQGSRAIGVVLSGAASDGAHGTQAIKAEGGITFAQDESAGFDGMPRAAIAAGAIDFVLPPKKIAKELLRIARHSYIAGTVVGTGRLPDNDLTTIFAMLRGAHDVDFTHYKPSTVERRIRRRMALNKIESPADYVRLLRQNHDELEKLYSDVLIRVTSFFRDPETFTALKTDIVPRLFEGRPSDTPVRVWVPGCATGEEVYSLAILMLEAASDLGVNCPIQIFGTDVSDAAIDYARIGVYPESIVADVSPERLRRFFNRVNGSYRVSKAVRDCSIFARQNLTKDPPFSKLDLISCRNVMIYLGASLQRKVMSIFHYALRPEGYLLLGSSETIGAFGNLFELVDRKQKIYRRKKGEGIRRPLELEAPAAPRERPVIGARPEEEEATGLNIFREADRAALARYQPPGVLINNDMDVIQFRGKTSTFLDLPTGTASFNILKMAREGLLADLRAAIHTAKRKDEPVRREGIRVKRNGQVITASLEVIPVHANKERYQLVLFQETKPPETFAIAPKGRGGRKQTKTQEAESRQVRRLKRELEATREYLQSIIEEQEAMNEELRSANEEIQSSNEELQSTNEELETAKEELQSSNEELTTLNEELENRNQELA